jgi:predicted transcriptional regulator
MAAKDTFTEELKIRVSPEVKTQFEQLAQKRDRSVSYLVREALTGFIATVDQPTPRLETSTTGGQS